MFKKISATLATIGGFGLCALADATAVVDTSAVSSTVSQIKTDLSSWVTSALPVVGAIAGAFFAFWLLRIAIRMVKSFASSGK